MFDDGKQADHRTPTPAHRITSGSSRVSLQAQATMRRGQGNEWTGLLHLETNRARVSLKSSGRSPRDAG